MPQFETKIVPISAGRVNSHEPHKQVLVPTRNESFVQISFSELLARYLRQQQAQETAHQGAAKSFTYPSAAPMTAAAPEHAFRAADQQICEKQAAHFVPVRFSFALANGAF